MNTVQIDRKRRVCVNGVRIFQVRDYKIETRPHTPVGVTLEFDAEDVDFAEEISETAVEQFTTMELLEELLKRKAAHKFYDSLNEETTIMAVYDGKL